MRYDPYEPFAAMSSKMKYRAKRPSYRSVFSNPRSPTDGDFRCLHCRNYVVQTSYLSGVQNRNHCPYCLWSKHVDLHQSGDRLSACKGGMRPIGLALKKRRKKYNPENSGELMLIHQCEECGKLSINRIAADDMSEILYEVFRASSTEIEGNSLQLEQNSSIQPLEEKDSKVLQERLFGVRRGIIA